MPHPLAVLLMAAVFVAAGAFAGFWGCEVLNLIAGSSQDSGFYALLGGATGMFYSIYLIWKTIQEDKKRKIIEKNYNLH